MFICCKSFDIRLKRFDKTLLKTCAGTSSIDLEELVPEQVDDLKLVPEQVSLPTHYFSRPTFEKWYSVSGIWYPERPVFVFNKDPNGCERIGARRVKTI